MPKKNYFQTRSIFWKFLAAVTFIFIGASLHADASDVTFAWDPNPETDIAGYRLKHGTSSGKYPETLDVGRSTSATVQNLSPGITYYFVLTAYNTAGIESPPSPEIPYTPPTSTSSTQTSNQAPVAVNDSVTIDEGSTATISVLLNDSDPDNSPSLLSIRSADSTSNGTTSVKGDKVAYTPKPGFFGKDTFSYSITDGDLSASATVTVNVQSTAKANNLAGAGLTGAAIGSATGGSRVLFDSSWELTGSCIGVSGISDNLYYENAKRTGNFQALARIQILTSDGTIPEVGLMLRESNASNARFAMIAATPDADAYALRKIAGGSAARTAVKVPVLFPNVWVLIQRIGDTIEFATSTDGVAFDSAGSTVISSLADSVNLGPFISSGMAGINARAVITDYTVIDLASSPNGTGLTGRYYAGTNFDTLVLTRIENIDFDWGNGSPDPSVPDNFFSVRWTGKLTPRYSENYTFYALTNNGVHLWVNGRLIIDNWGSNRLTEDSGSITLEAGQMYDIKMEYIEERGKASVALSWSSPSQPKEIVPVEVLYPDAQ